MPKQMVTAMSLFFALICFSLIELTLVEPTLAQQEEQPQESEAEVGTDLEEYLTEIISEVTSEVTSEPGSDEPEAKEDNFYNRIRLLFNGAKETPSIDDFGPKGPEDRLCIEVSKNNPFLVSYTFASGFTRTISSVGDLGDLVVTKILVGPNPTMRNDFRFFSVPLEQRRSLLIEKIIEGNTELIYEFRKKGVNLIYKVEGYLGNPNNKVNSYGHCFYRD